MMKLSRYWMTGCMALVLLVAGRGASASAREESERDERRGSVTASSQQPLDETARQLQQAARRHGFQVLVDLAPGAASAQTTRVLVLGRGDGRTPVIQAMGSDGGEGDWDLPMRLVLQASPDGSTRIIYGDPQALGGSADLPADMRRDVEALPSIVSAAVLTSDVDRRA